MKGVPMRGSLTGPSDRNGIENASSGTFQATAIISGIRFLSESNKNGVGMHFGCDFSPSRIQNSSQSHPWNTLTAVFQSAYALVCSELMFESCKKKNKQKTWPRVLPFCIWQSVSVTSWTRQTCDRSDHDVTSWPFSALHGQRGN